jgi:hypothetical protein
MQSGSTQDGILLVDRLLKDSSKAGTEASAPMLEALLVADRLSTQSNPVSQSRETSTYASAAPSYVRLVMESRQGLGWGMYSATDDALWALSDYAAQPGERVTKNLPNLTLDDRPVQAPSDSSTDGTISLIISGSEMHAGTNWLKLKAPATGQSLYYSLTLRATR